MRKDQTQDGERTYQVVSAIRPPHLRAVRNSADLLRTHRQLRTRRCSLRATGGHADSTLVLGVALSGHINLAAWRPIIASVDLQSLNRLSSGSIPWSICGTGSAGAPGP